MKPFYDPLKSYEENYANGPYGDFANPKSLPTQTSDATLFDIPVNSLFGIPAGPLINAKFCQGAFQNGFDINIYKTVRSRNYPCHPFPNTLAVKISGDLTMELAEKPLVAEAKFDTAQLSISNSFGVPSKDPEIWQADMSQALAAAGQGQILIGSFQGTRPENKSDDVAYIADHVTTAKLVVETGVPALELNLSCPNEGTNNLLCFDTELVVRIISAIKDAIGDVPLLLKMAYFKCQDTLETFITKTQNIVQGYAAINTIPARLVDESGNQALPGEGRAVSGVCGSAITWAGLEMTQRLAEIRATNDYNFLICGVGGVSKPSDYFKFRQSGADFVMSATGAMFNPGLAQDIKRELVCHPDAKQH